MKRSKIWNIGSRADESGRIAAIAEALGIGFPTACLLDRRGYHTPEEATAFLRLESEWLHDPFGLPDMEKACERLVGAIEAGEKIVVYGDYDVDGVTAVSLLCLYLRQVGGKVDYYIPHRMKEGYGVNREALKRLSEQGTTLIVTVDTGITAIEEVLYAASLGCDMVITDHHECHECLPEAVAVVNPHRKDSTYPFQELAGVGVAFKLVTALDYTLRVRQGRATDGFLEPLCASYIDLVTLGTVADVMPLRDENRLIVSMGLKYMEMSARPGIRALLDAADNGKTKGKRHMTSSVIGFTLAPRINAAGRMSSAERAVELFLTEDLKTASEIAEELCEINLRRQAEENKIVEQIRKRIEEDPTLAEAPVIVLEEDGWNHGVIGIVSSRITEKYAKPSILISFDGDLGKGSGRSVKGLNLVEALESCSEYLVQYGGHELAAGLTVRREDLASFRKQLCAYAEEQLRDRDAVAALEVDFELYPQEIGLRQAEELELLEPCGVSNPLPLFAMYSLTVQEVIPISQNRHAKFIFESGGHRFTAVYFGASVEELGFIPGDACDIAFQLTINEYQGNRTEQLLIRDIRIGERQRQTMADRVEKYRSVREGAIPVDAASLPRREDFASVYLHLKRSLPPNGGEVCLHTLLYALNGTPSHTGPMSYLRLRLSLDVLHDAGVIVLTPSEESDPGRERFDISLPHLDKKVNLEESCLYKELKASSKTATQA